MQLPQLIYLSLLLQFLFQICCKCASSLSLLWWSPTCTVALGNFATDTVLTSNRGNMHLGLICIWVLQSAVPSSGQSASENLINLEAQFWQWRMEDAPMFSTAVGETQFNDILESFSIHVYDQRNATVNDYLSRLKEINRDELDANQQLDYDIFTDYLQTYVDGVRWNSYFAMNPVNFLEGVQSNPRRMQTAMPFSTLQDYENYLKRLNKLPAQIHEKIELMKIAVSTGKTLNNVSVLAVPGQIDKLLTGPVEESGLYDPAFNSKLNASQVPENKRWTLREEGVKAVGKIRTALNELKTFLNETYLPATRPQWGLQWVSEGKEMYKQCLRYHTSTNMTPEEVHDKGLEEVRRIQTNMEDALNRLNFTGTIKQFFDNIREDPRFHEDTSEDLLDAYKDLIFNHTKPILHTMFKDIPDLPFEVKKMAYDGPPGSHIAGTPNGSVPGIFYANVMHPEDKPTLGMMALVLHEAFPGHHLQSTYSLASTLPPYRRFMEDDNYHRWPATFPVNTAYYEGWGLYAEYLGEELGLYTDDYMLMGRYSDEVFRACRLVVDTGLHYFGWDREEAIQYMLNNTVSTRRTVTNEIDRYLTIPGQATAYKIGELKIRELRQRASETLGSNFDLAEFHSLLLKNGRMPLRQLEQLVNNWITVVGARK